MPPENETPGECATCADNSPNKIVSRGNAIPNMIAYKPQGERGPTVYRDMTGIAPEHMARLNAATSPIQALASAISSFREEQDSVEPEHIAGQSVPPYLRTETHSLAEVVPALLVPASGYVRPGISPPGVPPTIIPPSFPLPPEAKEQEIRDFLDVIKRLLRAGTSKSMPRITTKSPRALRGKPDGVPNNRWLDNLERPARTITICEEQYFGWESLEAKHCIYELLEVEVLDAEPDKDWYRNKSKELRDKYGSEAARKAFEDSLQSLTAKLPSYCKAEVEVVLEKLANEMAICPDDCKQVVVELILWFAGDPKVEDPDTVQSKTDCQHFGQGIIYQDPDTKKWHMYSYVAWWVTIQWGVQFSITCLPEGF